MLEVLLSFLDKCVIPFLFSKHPNGTRERASIRCFYTKVDCHFPYYEVRNKKMIKGTVSELELRSLYELSVLKLQKRKGRNIIVYNLANSSFLHDNEKLLFYCTCVKINPKIVSVPNAFFSPGTVRIKSYNLLLSSLLFQFWPVFS